MSARALEQALAAEGIGCTIQLRDRLAVLTPLDDRSRELLCAAEPRRAAVALAVEHGFTHLALELAGEAAGAAGAALSRD